MLADTLPAESKFVYVFQQSELEAHEDFRVEASFPELAWMRDTHVPEACISSPNLEQSRGVPLIAVSFVQQKQTKKRKRTKSQRLLLGPLPAVGMSYEYVPHVEKFRERVRDVETILRDALNTRQSRPEDLGEFRRLLSFQAVLSLPGKDREDDPALEPGHGSCVEVDFLTTMRRPKSHLFAAEGPLGRDATALWSVRLRDHGEKDAVPHTLELILAYWCTGRFSVVATIHRRTRNVQF